MMSKEVVAIQVEVIEREKEPKYIQKLIQQ